MTFLTPGRYRVAALSIRILLEPKHDSVMDEQALMGEEVEVLDTSDEFTLIRIKFSAKTGWISSASQKLIAIGKGSAPTNRVIFPRAVTFRKPNPETETMVILPLNAQISLGDRETFGGDEFARVNGLGTTEAWIRTSMLMPLGTYEKDFVAVQERLLGTPYVWGGRDSTLGMDCSRLLGESLRATGRNHCPGDTREQAGSSWLGNELLDHGAEFGLERGDLIFWKGHVATMTNASRCIHATDRKPYHQVIGQDLAEVIHERKSAGKGGIVMVRRFEDYRRNMLKRLAI